jgi:adenosylmethionine---8-amino-7-oxononanoate aminotransferase
MRQPRSPVWHPFAQHALQEEFPTVVRAEGAYLETADGRRIIDAIASWWVITHGHRHPHIMTAIREQAERLDQVIFAEYTHEPAERLARGLVSIAPEGLTHVFFSDSGSTSVEVALKMALGFWHHRGSSRRRIVVMQGSYHGDTVGAMSVGARGVFTQSYEPLLFEVGTIPFPLPGRERATLDALEALCRRPDTAAFIVEPLVLGAGGMLMYPPQVLRELHRICRAHEVLFIADEVMTGWGRTGSRFACEQADVVPDIACYSKGLTGGSLPLAVTLCRAEIFETHYSHDRRRTFFHSSSFTANPIACAAALANLEVWEREPVRARIAELESMQREFLASFADDARFADLRQTGTIAAMDVRVPDSGYLASVGPRLTAAFRAAGVLLRPLGNTIYVLPPYCVTRRDLEMVYGVIRDSVRRLADG